MMEWSVDLRQNRIKEKKQTEWMPELCRQKLIGYAESFWELSRTFRELSENLPEETAEQGPSRQNILEEKRRDEGRQAMGENLSAMAQIMVRVADEMTAYQPMEEKKKRILIHALRAEGIYIENLYYLPEKGKRKGLSMTMHTEKKGGRSAAEVADMLSVLLHIQLQLSVTSPYRVDQTSRCFVFVEQASFIALTGFAKAVKEGETISGDHYAIVESEQGKMNILLSDGTGSGEKASAGSEQVLDLMEKMMEAGYDTTEAVHMVNTAFFAMGQEENHPTLDICELDLYQGCCDIRKVGGAATFLKRGEEVEQIVMGSLPLGIFQTVDAEQIHRELQNGDYLIMMTDGVLDALEEHGYEDTMMEAIRELREQNPGEIAEKLLQIVLCLSGGRIRDDMTILVAGVWENS